MEQGYSKEGSSVTNQKWLKSVVGCVFQPDLARDGTLVNIVQRIRIEVIPKEVWRGLADFAKPKKSAKYADRIKEQKKRDARDSKGNPFEFE